MSCLCPGALGFTLVPAYYKEGEARGIMVQEWVPPEEMDEAFGVDDGDEHSELTDLPLGTTRRLPTMMLAPVPVPCWCWCWW